MAFVELAPCCLLSICVSLTSARYIDGWALLFWLEIDPSEILPWVLVITLCTWIAAEVYGMWMHIIKSPKSKEEHAFDGCPVVLNFLSRFYMFFFSWTRYLTCWLLSWLLTRGSDSRRCPIVSAYSWWLASVPVVVTDMSCWMPSFASRWKVSVTSYRICIFLLPCTRI